MTLKHFLKRQNRSKNKIRKITAKSRNDVKSACFWHVLCYISAIFEDIDLKFCTHIHETLPSNICYGFFEILIWGETVWKIKKLNLFLKIFQNFQKPILLIKIGETWRHSDVTHGWPIMTWVLIFWHKVWNCWPERYGKFQSEIPSTSGAICEKPQGGEG